MPDIAVTLPAREEWSDYRRELSAAADGSSEMHFKVQGLPDVAPGDRCYLVHRGAARGWMAVSRAWRGSFDCTTTGRRWEGSFVSRSGPFHELDPPIPMRGFQGFRYAAGTPLAEHFHVGDAPRREKDMIAGNEEPAAAPDPVASAAAALAEAAHASAAEYTSGALAAHASAAAEAEAGAGALNEAGGLMSWLRRAYFGMDPKALDEVRAEMSKGIRTAQDRDRLVEHIGKLIGEAEIARHGAKAKAMDGKNPHTPMAIMRRWNQKTGNIGRYIAALEKVRGELRRVHPTG